MSDLGKNNRNGGKDSRAEVPLQLPAALQRPGKGGVIGKFQMSAHGDAVGQSGHLYVKGLEEPGDVHGGGLAFRIRVCSHDDLLYAALRHPLQQA